MCRLHSSCLLWWLHFNTSIQESTPSTLDCNFVPVLAFLMFSAAFQLFFCVLLNFSSAFWAFSFSLFYLPSFLFSIPFVFPSLSSFLPFLLPLLLSAFLAPFHLELPVLIKCICRGAVWTQKKYQADPNTLSRH